MMKAVVQTSGGIESSTMLLLAMEKLGRDNVYPIAFDDGSVTWNTKDRIGVERVLKHYRIYERLFTCRIPQVDFLEEVDDKRDLGIIPGYKMFLNLSSLAFAHKVGATEVWIGNMESENNFDDDQPDKIDELFRLYNATYMPGTPILPLFPFRKFEKADVIQLAVKMSVPLNQTISCTNERLAGGYNCGICDGCTKRRAGFAAARIEDPSRYILL